MLQLPTPGGVRPLPYGQVRNVSGVPQVTSPSASMAGWDITPDIQQQVFGIVNPQLQSAADIINRRSAMGSQMIGGLTGAFTSAMGNLGPNPFQPEQAGLRSAAEWAKSTLTGAGRSQAQSLAAALAQAGPGIRGPGDVNLAKQGKGAGAAAYGTGIADLDAMIAKAAATQTRMALEPSFAAGMGQQNQSMLAAQLARQLSEQQSTIMGQVPELVMNLQNQSYARQQDLRDYQERVRQFNVSRSDQLAANKAKVVGPNAPTTAGRLAYYQAQADFRTKHDPNGYVWEGTTTGIRPVADRKTGKPIVDPGFAAAQAQGLIPKAVKVGNTVGHYDSGGKFVPDYTAPYKPTTPANLTFKNVMGPDGKVHTVGVDPKTGKQRVDLGIAGTGAKAGTTVKMPTPQQTGNFVRGWYTGTQTSELRQVGKDKQGNPKYAKVPTDTVGQVSYQEAYKKLRQMHYNDAQARSYLDTYWKRGERGRPWLGVSQRTALKKAGLPTVAQYWRGDPQYAYIGAKQYAALKRLGIAPPAIEKRGLWFIQPETA